MTHTERTADKCYIRPDLPSISASSHATLKKNIGYIEEGDGEVDSDKEKSAVETSNKVEADLKSDKGVLEHQCNASLETLFEEEISSNRVPTIKEVTTKLSQSNDLCELVNSEQAIKKCINCLRYVIWNTKKQQDDRPPIKTCSRDFTEEWLTSHFQCRSELETHHSEWSNEDTERIHNHFKDFPFCPDKATIMTHFESDSLRDIYDREGLKRYYEKVKNMFKSLV